jgi:O-succinylbenzoate synthase
MAWRVQIQKRVFTFGFQAKTSRGSMQTKDSWFINLWDDNMPDVVGIGECGPLPGLSVDAVPHYETVLKGWASKIENSTRTPEEIEATIPVGFPSIRFGVETALRDWQHGGKRIIFDNSFIKGNAIPINGLVWMGDVAFTVQQIEQKVAAGFRCIKMKIGGLDFDQECEVLQFLRETYQDRGIELRLDANGSFHEDVVFERLNALAKFNPQSIEQPLPVGSALLPRVCATSPFPTALDEELIGVEATSEKEALLHCVKPSYIILKPSLHGGISGCKAWIQLAESMNIGWWITSALESNIGLNAICQFTAEYDIQIPQGLGTGGIYTNNIPAPLVVKDGHIYHDSTKRWDISINA